MNFFTIILVNPIINILVVIYQGLLYLHIPYPLGFSIIILTVASRFLLLPFTNSTIRHSKKMQSLNPHISKLKEKHKGDSKMIQSETMKLYKEHGVNPAAGCLPALIQIPIALGLYNSLRGVVDPKTVVATVNKVLYFPALHLHKTWDAHFFGLSLGASPSQMLHTYGYAILLVPVITALLQMIQSKMMFASQKSPEPATPETSLAVKDGEKPQKKSTSDDFASAMQTQTMYIIPLVIGYSSFNFPLGLSLYWNTFTIFGIIQQYTMNGWGSLQDWIDIAKSKIK